MGSRKYTDRKKIKDFIFKIKQKYGTNAYIISGGCKQGADHYAKKYALEFDMRYEEYLPKHEPYNDYCALDASYYGKSYHVTNFFERNRQLAKNSDMVIAFCPENEITSGTNDTLKNAKKFNKKTLIIT